MPTPLVRAAVVQAEVSTTLAAGLEQTAALARAAVAQGAALVVFPETWLPGYPAWLDVCRDVALWDHAPTKAVFGRRAAESVHVTGAGRAALARIAGSLSITLVVGVTECNAGGPARGTLCDSL